MNRFISTPLATVLLLSFVGCSSSTQSMTVVSTQEAARGDYCNKKLQSGSRTTAPGDIIDYYGPCDGPSVSEQIQQQRRFESYRFGRDYMDEG